MNSGDRWDFRFSQIPDAAPEITHKFRSNTHVPSRSISRQSGQCAFVHGLQNLGRQKAVVAQRVKDRSHRPNVLMPGEDAQASQDLYVEAKKTAKSLIPPNLASNFQLRISKTTWSVVALSHAAARGFRRPLNRAATGR
jgi:hypothetical protein